jgi:DNA-binding protein H-NS
MFALVALDQEATRPRTLRRLRAYGRCAAKRAELEKQLAALGYGAPKKRGRPKGVSNGNGAVRPNGKRGSVKVKYRDPKTNDTWSGRGRMASWLKSKQDAGEKIDKYLV